jgi:cysteine-rich repeat protein
LRELDVPTASSTFRIYGREAILNDALTAVAMTVGANADEAIVAADATAGNITVTLGGTASATDDTYNGMKLRILSDGVHDEYTITDYDGGTKVASVSPPLARSYESTGSAYNILRVYEIYEDLGAACLTNVNMTVTYTYGTARTVSNDPGELSTIHSNWDRESARAQGAADLPEQRDVRSWTLKLAGEGYYGNLYSGEGLSSYDNNANKASGAQIATTAAPPLSDYTPVGGSAGSDPFAILTVANGATIAGLQVGQFVKITDGASPVEKYEVVKVVNKVSATTVLVQRAQLGTQKQTFANAAHFVYTVGFNRGQGMDELAELGGTSRYSSAHDDAYTGLWVTIVAGTGAGQTRWISDYHGDSRTVYLGGSPWSTIPDTTSKYKIWYSAEVVEQVPCRSTMARPCVDSGGQLVYASYPRPVKKGYLIEFAWYGCSKEVPESLLNNAWTGTTARTLRQNYASNQARPGLAQCKGQLGMRKPKQGPAKVYPRFKVLQTDYATGVVKAADTEKTHLTLDQHVKTDPGAYVGRQIIVKNGATVRGTATIMQSFVGGKGTQIAAAGTSSANALNPNTEFRFVEVYLDQAVTGAVADDTYTINPAPGVSGSTTISEDGQNGEQYTMEEVDVVRYEYPELIEQHREWPHGYSYLQMKAGEDGEHIGNLFLKDYTQYSTESYYTDSITIPRSVFENYVRSGPNGVSGEFPFTLKAPPGRGNIELLSIVIGYPVLKQEDASSYDSTDIETARKSSHGPPPFFPYSPGWSGVDESARTTRTHPRFQTHAYTSTCGNGVHDAGEYCDDGNHVDGDGCSSACSLEAGWTCETVALRAPSVCRKGAVGSRVPDQEVGCKMYACEPPPERSTGNGAAAFGPIVTAGNIATWLAAFADAGKNPTGVANRAIICSGTPTDGTQHFYGITGGAQVDSATYEGVAGAVNPYGPNFPICKLDNIQGTCSLCVKWDNSDSTLGDTSAHATNNDQTGITGGILQDSGVAGYDGSSKRRLLVDSDATVSSPVASTGEETESVTL